MPVVDQSSPVTDVQQAVPVAQEVALVAVTQTDRDAAANADVMNAMTNAASRYGRCDNIAIVQAFARHRVDATQTREAELVAALNEIADLGSCANGRTPAYKLFQRAIDIATGAL